MSSAPAAPGIPQLAHELQKLKGCPILLQNALFGALAEARGLCVDEESLQMPGARSRMAEIQSIFRRFGMAENAPVELLAYLFEQSQHPIQRKAQGVFYTPPSMAAFIVGQTLGDKPSKKIRILDLACGAGAFLLAALEHLSREEAPEHIVQHSLFGVDINAEALEISKRLLWLKSAGPGDIYGQIKTNLLCANALVDEVPGGAFDVVLGNPPYIRHEQLAKEKQKLSQAYQSYCGTADLYLYFIERGLSLLKPGGRLGYIVPNKWMRSAYGQKLRSLLAKEACIDRIIDFGHSSIFPGADAFPCIITLYKSPPSPEHSLEATPAPQTPLNASQIGEHLLGPRHKILQCRLGSAPWSLEDPAVQALMDKVRQKGIPLAEYAKTKAYYGIKTGLNEAFCIDTGTKERLIQDDPKSAHFIKKYLRGQDIGRWLPEWKEQWMITIKSSPERPTPWIDLDEKAAEPCFQKHYPALYARMKSFEPALRARKSRGRYWWELQCCPPDSLLEQPKIIWKDLCFHSEFCLDQEGYFTNNLCYILPSADLWLLAVLNSALLWSYLWRHTLHGKDEVLRLRNSDMEKLPIAPPSPEARAEAQNILSQLIRPVQAPNSHTLEQRLNTLVNSAYDLAPEDIELLRRSAPPRMPPVH